MLSREENELLTRTGPGTRMGALLRRYWTPILTSDQLPVQDCPPVRVRILGEDLVAYRETDGEIGLLEEHCAHRGASLFFGRNEECGLRCVYHGWKYDRTGQCVDMPSEPAESDFHLKIKLTAYPCRDRGGVIWAYMGPPALEPALPDLEWADAPASHRFLTRRRQDSNWLQAMEGGIDAVHVPFLHRKTPRDSSVPEPRRVEEIYETKYGFMVARKQLGGPQAHWSVNHWLMPYYKVLSRRGTDGLVLGHVWVPVDDESCLVFSMDWHPDRPLTEEEIAYCMSYDWIHAEKIPGTARARLHRDNDYQIDRALQASGRSFTGIKGFGIQDTAMQESMGPVQDRTKEHLGTTDQAIIKGRRYFLRVLKGLADGREPPARDAALFRVHAAEFSAPADATFLDVAGDDLRANAGAPPRVAV